MAANAPNWPLISVIVLWLVIQYGFAAWALRDLARRPRVRGEKKVLWAFLILIVPIAGPVIYSSLGPTSFLPRPRPRPGRPGEPPPTPPRPSRPPDRP